MNRFLYGAALAAFALTPAGVAADTNLQPPLDQILVPAPSGYALFKPSGLPHGFFGLDEYAASWGGENAADASQQLQQYGFVGGYELQWTDPTNVHVLIESVIAFAGGRGARSWFLTSNKGDHNDTAYRHDDLDPGLGADAYGVHSVLPSSHGDLVLDAFVFARGNDVVAVGFLSEHDDVLDAATSQASSQYSHTPDYTLPPSQWPENATSSQDAFPLTGVLIGVLVLGLLAAGVGGGYVMLQRTRAPSPVAVAAAPMPFQVSPDGRYWFDGARWIDSAQDPPPFAQRSPDGSMWWDGYVWRPVPQSARTR